MSCSDKVLWISQTTKVAKQNKENKVCLVPAGDFNVLFTYCMCFVFPVFDELIEYVEQGP